MFVMRRPISEWNNKMRLIGDLFFLSLALSKKRVFLYVYILTMQQTF